MARPFDPRETGLTKDDRENSRLLRALAVAGFAASNVMLLSVAVWSGNVSDITPEQRDFFHWLSALIALPAAAYAGRPFFHSAIRAIAARRLNMDVPITVGVLLARSLGTAFQSGLVISGRSLTQNFSGLDKPSAVRTRIS